MIKAPCKDCLDRTLSCHSSCQKYSDYREKLTAAKQAKRRDSVMNEVRYNGNQNIKNRLANNAWRQHK